VVVVVVLVVVEASPVLAVTVSLETLGVSPDVDWSVGDTVYESEEVPEGSAAAW